MRLFKKYRVLVINPALVKGKDLEVLLQNTPLPVVLDETIPNLFIVRRTDKED